jgi:hypothetical protein
MNLDNPLSMPAHFADPSAFAAAMPLRSRVAGVAAAHVLVLFGADWDDRLLARYARTGRYRFHEHGFDLFKFPGNARLLWFDLWRFVDRMTARYRGRIDAVFSSNEPFGALAAALVAERLDLPGADPASLIRAQHKYEARLHLQAFAPELCPAFELIPYTMTLEAARKLRYPLFVKPVRATFSVLARRCDTAEQLLGHLRFEPWERHIIKRLVEPHNQALKRFPQFRVSSRHMLVEDLLEGRQINVDGFMRNGQAHFLGLADEVMYPGTMAFMRFACPGRIDAALTRRIHEASQKVLRGFGLTHGFFNLEFFVDAAGSLKLIEINPRLAAQLAQFSEWVSGIDTYEIGFALASNRPLPSPHVPRFGAAASFVWRSFDGRTCPRLPSAADHEWLRREYPQARLEVYAKSGASLRRELKWLGSHRWAVLNMPGFDEADLRWRYERVCDRLGWPAPY